MTLSLALSIASFVVVSIISLAQLRSAIKRANSGEALDWSTAAKNLREENNQLREDLKKLRQEFSVVKDLARRIIKNPPEKGDVIVLSPVEQALLFDTGSKFKDMNK